MHFEIIHEFDAPLDVVELAVLSRELGPLMGESLRMIESVETVEHVFDHGVLRRILKFQASAPLPIFKRHQVAKEALEWREISTYRVADHASEWVVTPREEWQHYFRSHGTYTLEVVPHGRTRRTVRGELEVKAGWFKNLVERMAVVEVKKTYDAEANTLRKLALL